MKEIFCIHASFAEALILRYRGLNSKRVHGAYSTIRDKAVNTKKEEVHESFWLTPVVQDGWKAEREDCDGGKFHKVAYCKPLNLSRLRIKIHA